jgi:sigma-E factor negative regulatory protein RseC
MSSREALVSHPGTINKIEGDRVFVRIAAESACASCHVKGSCSVANMADKIVEVHSPANDNLKVGTTVTVSMKQAMGTKAVLLAYFLPFILVMACLITLINITGNELLAGLVSLSVLAPYYLVLYFFRHRMGKTFYFEIQHSSTHLPNL